MHKLIRITTVPVSLEKLLEGQLKFMSDHYNVIAISADKAQLEKVAKRENVVFFEVNLTRKITPLKDLKAVFKLYRFLKKESPSIIHTHTPKAGMVGMIASKLARVPVRLHTVAGLPLMEINGLKRKILNLVEKLTYACATKVYPNSKGLKEFIIENKFASANKLKVIGNGSSNGIDTDWFAPEKYSEAAKDKLRDSLRIAKEDFVFIFVGRLVSDKGINELISAFNQIHQEHRVKLLLVGAQEQELDPLNMQTLSIINKNKDIISVGFQKDVRPYFAISDCLTFPSYREGFPNVVMQAGAMGLPSIVSNINGCNEIIEHGKNGLIIPSKSSQGLKEKMLKVFHDEKLYEFLKKNSRDMIVNRYEQQMVWKAILKEYKKALQYV